MAYRLSTGTGLEPERETTMTTLPVQQGRGLTPQQLEEAAEAIERDGVVALTGAIPQAELAVLREQMLRDVEEEDARADGPAVGNAWQGLRPPPLLPWLFESIVFNAAAESVPRRVFGDRPVLTSYGSQLAPRQQQGRGEQGGGGGEDTALEQQHVHLDCGLPQPPGPPVAITMQILLTPCTVENGATQYWPGSHAQGERLRHKGWSNPEPYLNEHAVRDFDHKRPSGLFTGDVGTLILRDPRMWHRGRVNRSAEHRLMLTLATLKESALLECKAAGGTTDWPAGDGKTRVISVVTRAPIGFEAEETTAEFWEGRMPGDGGDKWAAAVWRARTQAASAPWRVLSLRTDCGVLGVCCAVVPAPLDYKHQSHSNAWLREDADTTRPDWARL